MRLGERFGEALVYAHEAHAGQVRKGGDTPYIGHLLAVAGIVIEEGGSEDEAIAALLHDAVEDQGGAARLAQIRERFGEAVAAVVEECSDAMGEPKGDWGLRKQHYLDRLPTASTGAIRVTLADKVDNLRSLLRDHALGGEGVWARFNAGPSQQLWYLHRVAEILLARAPGPLARELSHGVDELERRVAREQDPSRPVWHWVKVGSNPVFCAVAGGQVAAVAYRTEGEPGADERGEPTVAPAGWAWFRHTEPGEHEDLEVENPDSDEGRGSLDPLDDAALDAAKEPIERHLKASGLGRTEGAP